MGAQSTDSGPGALERHLAEVGVRPESLDLRLGGLLETGFDPGQAKARCQEVRQLLGRERLSIANHSIGQLHTLFR
jgi:hypothetical protein